MFINLKYIYGIKRSAKICKNKERNLLFPQTDNSKQMETQYLQGAKVKGQRDSGTTSNQGQWAGDRLSGLV